MAENPSRFVPPSTAGVQQTASVVTAAKSGRVVPLLCFSYKLGTPPRSLVLAPALALSPTLSTQSHRGHIHLPQLRPNGHHARSSSPVYPAPCCSIWSTTPESRARLHGQLRPSALAAAPRRAPSPAAAPR
uniref:Uncharacterized protein n=1 Tax=Arundo donax TaxID=35708 RepID=A0A0A9C4R2_ARUDO